MKTLRPQKTSFEVDNSSMPNELRTSRTALRRLEPTHAEDYAELFRSNYDRLVPHFAPEFRALDEVNGMRNFISKKLREWDQRTTYLYGIFNTENQLIGKVEVYGLAWDIPKAYVSYFISDTYEGKGLISEVVNRLLSYCYEQMGFLKIELRTSTDNTASHNIARRFGFRHEGTLTQNYRRYSGEVVDLMVWGLGREEWKKNQQSRRNEQEP